MSRNYAEIVQSAVLRIKSANNKVCRPFPSLFSYPGLTSKPLHPAQEFPQITEALKANYDAILSDYQTLRAVQENDYDTSSDEHKKLHTGDWKWLSYVQKGARQPDFAAHALRTCEVLESFDEPKLMVGTPFSYAFFSTLAGKSSIAAHYGPCNLRVRCHFPLKVPAGDCGMRIGNETVKWKEGEALFFDDTYEHEVFNKTDEERVVLLFDLWHPELTADEIDAIDGMFAYAREQGWLSKTST